MGARSLTDGAHPCDPLEDSVVTPVIALTVIAAAVVVAALASFRRRDIIAT
jgi:putative exporter of polyketide antibiotics